MNGGGEDPDNYDRGSVSFRERHEGGRFAIIHAAPKIGLLHLQTTVLIQNLPFT
jgi:hypothetical protein